MDNQIKYEGTLNLGENKLPCYVLEDGTRVLSGRKMQEILKVVDGNISGTKLPQFLSNSILKHSFSAIKTRHILIQLYALKVNSELMVMRLLF